MLKKEEHDQLINDIVESLKNETIDISTITTNLDKIRDNYSESIQFESDCNKLKEDNEKLRNTNMNLFLKLGDSNKNNLTNHKTNEVEEENKNINALDSLADEYLK